MAKAPRVGAGKQRLARDIGAVEAWRVNRALQARTMRAACDPRWRTILCVTPDHACALQLSGVWPRGVARIAQGRGDLGARLARALEPHRNVAVIGTDCPAVSRAHIAAAFAALKRAPFALGPAEDGGFWILAARSGRAAAAAMARVRWSSAHAAEDVLADLAPLPRSGGGVGEGVSAHHHGPPPQPLPRKRERGFVLLPTLADIDTGEDLRRWSQRSARRASSGS